MKYLNLILVYLKRTASLLVLLQKPLSYRFNLCMSDKYLLQQVYEFVIKSSSFIKRF